MINILTYIISLSWLLSQIIRIQLGNGLSINILDVSVGVAAILMLISFIIKRKLHLLLKDNLGKSIIIFTGILIFSLLWNYRSLNFQQFAISGFYLIRWISYLSIFFYIRESGRGFKDKIIKIMQITGISFLILGYVQFFNYSSLKNIFYLGWDEHMYRLFSVFLDPNFSGIFLVLFIIFMVGKRLEMKQKLFTKKKIALSILIALAMGGLILTFSRSAYVMFIFASVVLLTLFNKKRWILIMLCLMFAVGIVLSQRFYIENVNLFRTFSSKERLASMGQALEIFSRKPILGVGFNAYRYAQLQYGFKGQVNIDASHADSGTDNSFLFVLATTGIVGLAAYLAVLTTVAINAYASFKINRNVNSAIVFSSIMGLCVASMFINSLFFPPIMLWMWGLLGTQE